MNLDSRGKVLKIASFEGPKILRVNDFFLGEGGEKESGVLG